MNKEEQIKFIQDNYPAYTSHISKRRIRHDFFQNIETEIQAYLLGFYAADGSIDEKRKTFRIHLQDKDVEIIYLYKDFISNDARLFQKLPKEENIIRTKIIQGHGSTGIDITSSKLVHDLINLGIGYKKTYYDLHIPNIPESLIRHFIRGYFDGDGCITGYYVKPDLKYKKNERFRFHVDIDAKNNCLLLEFQKYFADNNIKSNINYLMRDDMYRLTIGSKKELINLFKLLYDSSNFYLSRKFNKFNYYVNTEVSQLIADHRNA